MAAFMDKMQVNTAITDNTKMDLSCDHVTTSSFFDIHPVYIKEMVPGESLNMRAQVFARLQPLLNPTFGRCNVNARAFFVPMRTLWLQWNDFITDAPYVAGQSYNNQMAPTGYVPTSVPTTSAEQICELFARHTGTAFVGAVADTEWGTSSTTAPSAYDYEFYLPANGASTASTSEYITLNEKGRRIVKVLESLGYKVPCYKNSGLGSFSVGDDQYSMLPLFAYAKIYIDWYVNSAYSVSNNDVAYIQSYLNSTSAAGPISTGALYTILNFIISANYDSDYFVSAWDLPVAPAAGTFSSMSMVDVTIVGSNGLPVTTNNTLVQTGSASGTPYMVQNGSSQVNIGSRYIHDVLDSMSDYVKRHQLVGAHAFDRYLARFGKALNSEKLRRSVYIGSKITPVQFGDVMSQTGANGTNGTSTVLGDYAGKGVAYGDGQFDFSTDEYGYFIVIGTIIPSVGYVQGIDRMITHVTKLDFWTPEFDNLGVQAIRKDELYLSKDGSSTLGQYSSMGSAGSPFGFIPRYAEYKVSKDKLTGEFSFKSRNVGMDSWYGFRMFDDANFTNGAADVVHGYDFTSGEADGDQYNRIFRNWDSKTAPDQFYMIWHFDVRDNSPMKSLFDSYEFESEDEGSKKVTEQAGGVKMN